MKTIIVLIISIQCVFAQTLEDYLKIAEKENPTLQYYALSYDIAKEKIGEVGNLKDTKFSAGYFIYPPETRLGAQRIKLGVQQSFPWPGSLKAEKSFVRTRSVEKLFDESIAKRKLFYAIKKQYYQLYANHAISDVLSENKEILDIYEKMALASLENNHSRMSDVLKIRIQKNELHFKKYSNFNDSKVLVNQFNRLLNRKEESIVNVLDSLSVVDIKLSDQPYLGHPELAKIDSKKQTKNAEKSWLSYDRKPEITTGLDYISVSERQDIDLSKNGRDIFMPKIGLNIPLFTQKYNAKERRIDLELRRLDVEKYNKEKLFRDEIDRANVNLNNAILQVVAAQKNKDQIQRALNSDLKAYETGTLDYDNILKMQLQKIKYQLSEIEGTKNAYLQKSMIEYIINR